MKITFKPSNASWKVQNKQRFSQMYKILPLLSLFFSLNCLACGCPPPKLEEEVSEAESIYIGTVVSANADKDGIVIGNLEVNRLLKGKLNGNTAKVKTDLSDCGVPLTIGRTYIIFKSTDSLVIEACGFTHEINRLYEEDFAKMVLEAEKAIQRNNTKNH